MQQKIYYIRIYWTDGIFSAQCLFTKAAWLLWQHKVELSWNLMAHGDAR